MCDTFIIIPFVNELVVLFRYDPLLARAVSGSHIGHSGLLV